MFHSTFFVVGFIFPWMGVHFCKFQGLGYLLDDFGAHGIHHSCSLTCSLFFPGPGSCFANSQRLVSLLHVFVLFPHLHDCGILCFSVAQAMGGTYPQIFGAN